MVRKLLAGAAFLAMAMSIAMADEAEGIVSDYDPETGWILLDSGDEYVLGEEAEDGSLAPGAAVTLVYHVEDGEFVVDEVVAD